MLDLWLMRHGEAVDPDEATSDAERGLTDRGRHEVAGLARWLGSRVALPQVIWHSPLRRARQTASVFADELDLQQHVREAAVMAPGMTPERLVVELSRSTATPILCVGHQPDIGRCLSELIGGGRFEIAPGFCAGIHFRDLIRPGAGQLMWAIAPQWFGG